MKTVGTPVYVSVGNESADKWGGDPKVEDQLSIYFTDNEFMKKWGVALNSGEAGY